MIEFNEFKFLESLLQNNLISPSQYQQILHHNLPNLSNNNLSIIDILLKASYVEEVSLYQHLSHFLSADILSLGDLLMLDNSRFKGIALWGNFNDYVKYNFFPIEKKANSITIIISNITKEGAYFIRRQFAGLNIELIVVSKTNLCTFLQKLFGSEILDNSINNRNGDISTKNVKLKLINLKVIFLLIVIVYTVLRFSNVISIIFITINILYISNLLFKTIVFAVGLHENYKNKSTSMPKLPVEVEIEEMSDNLPVYTIIIPLYKESEVVNQMIKAIDDLIYPKEKLDVKIVIESDDYITKKSLLDNGLKGYHHLIEVPFANPKTKPKACNFALQFAIGKYTVIYDAEDIPDPYQLQLAVDKFKIVKNSKKQVICLQAKLNYYNHSRNILTSLFAIEYSIWFDYIIVGLSKLGIIFPLGGTSNHIETICLKDINAWDAHNVTEDAELGIKMGTRGYKAILLNSTTLEESPTSLFAWLRQRSRWIKGYMQTYLTYSNRKNSSFLKKLSFIDFVAYHLLIGFSTATFLIMPIFLLLWYFIVFDGANNQSVIYSVFRITSTISVLSTLISLIVAGFISMKCNGLKRLWIVLLYPFYFILHSIASYRALRQLFTDPYLWEKTQHFGTKNK